MLLPLLQFSLCLIPSVCVYIYLKEKKKLEAEYQDRLKALETKTQADPILIEAIFSDFRAKGFSIVRIDSNDIFYRSPKG
jgi:hypothetical protein